MLELNKIYQGNCLDLIKEIPDSSIDMILQDPPYNTTACKWEWDIMTKIEEFWYEWKRIIKPRGAIVMTASQPFTSALVMSNIKWFKYEWVWHKNFSGGFATAKKRPMKYHENIVVFYLKQPKYNPQFEEYADSVKKRFRKSGKVSLAKIPKNKIQGIKTVQSYINYERGKYPSSVQFIKADENANNKRVHPTQKPVALFEYLIKTYTNEGDVVFDGFAGSGTTAIAAINTNRQYICCELDKEYVKVANNRINNIEPSLLSK
jgi:site-specific DNA-methyltransferase (adenine-specific)